MATIKCFEDLEVWKEARLLTKSVYAVSARGNFGRDFVLRDQVRRAVVSITSNIAEGFERGGSKEFVQFLSLARGSCGELRAQLYIALDQSYLTDEQFNSLLSQTRKISRMLTSLMNYLRRTVIRGDKFLMPENR